MQNRRTMENAIPTRSRLPIVWYSRSPAVLTHVYDANGSLKESDYEALLHHLIVAHAARASPSSASTVSAGCPVPVFGQRELQGDKAVWRRPASLIRRELPPVAAPTSLVPVCSEECVWDPDRLWLSPQNAPRPSEPSMPTRSFSTATEHWALH